MKVFLFLFFVLILVFLFSLLVYSLSFSSFLGEWAKGSPFECGFQPFEFSSISFSMPFFVISLMFLLFDVEILLVCFFPIFNFFLLNMTSFIIILLIFFSTIYEWAKGGITWF